MHAKDASEVLDQKVKLEKQYANYQKQSKENISNLTQNIIELTKQNKDLNLEKDKVDLKLVLLIGERDKMKQRITKLKNRKGKVDQGIKMCKNCGREFHNDNNFNWSCRVHRTPEYGGELWWCCGKIGKDVPGCKFAKHESKEDDDEDDEEDL